MASVEIFGQRRFPAVTTYTTTATAAVNDDVILCSTAGGAWTLTLPTAVGITGKIFRIKKTTNDANLLTIDPNGSETIDGSTTFGLNGQYNMVTLVSDGANWLVIKGHGLAMCRYTTAAAQSIPNNTTTLVDFSSVRVFDTHNAYRAGVGYNSGTGTYSTTPGWIVPVGLGGRYYVSARMLTASVAWTAGNTYAGYITVNGSIVAAIRQVTHAALTNHMPMLASAVINVSAGDVINAMALHERGSATALFNDSNHVQFELFKLD